MKSRFLLVMLFTIVGLSVATRAAGEESTPGFDKIVLGSSGGFSGRGSGKALTIETTGEIVTKTGNKEKKGKLTAGELERLKVLVAAVPWKELKANYIAGNDTFIDDLAVTIGSMEHKTHASREVRPRDLPKELATLLGFLDTLGERHKP